MPKPGRKKRIILGPGTTFVDVNLVDKLTTEEGSGPSFRRRIATFNNGAENGRKVHTRSITHKARLEGDLPDDDTQTLDVEVIDSVSSTEGSGPSYIKRILKLNPDPDSNGERKTHIVRLTHKADPDDPDDEDDEDTWLEIERVDQFTTTEGSGPSFVRRIQSLNWNDEEFDAPNDTVPDASPGDGFDPPWRLDPFQNIVNISSGPPPWIILEVDLTRGNYVGSLYGNDVTGDPLVPDQGYTDGHFTSFGVSWVTFFNTRSTTASGFTSYEYSGASRPETGTQTFTGDWAKSFSVTVGAGATMTAVGPDQGYGISVWTPGPPYVFKPGSPGSDASNNPKSPSYVPPPTGAFGSHNTDWRTGSFTFSSVAYADEITSGATFLVPGVFGSPSPLLAQCSTGTFGNVAPNVAGTVTFDFSGVVFSALMPNGKWIDYHPVAAADGGVNSALILMLGTPRIIP